MGDLAPTERMHASSSFTPQPAPSASHQCTSRISNIDDALSCRLRMGNALAEQSQQAFYLHDSPSIKAHASSASRHMTPSSFAFMPPWPWNPSPAAQWLPENVCPGAAATRSSLPYLYSLQSLSSRPHFCLDTRWRCHPSPRRLLFLSSKRRRASNGVRYRRVSSPGQPE